MDNTFIEQMVKQENKSKNILIKIGLIVLAIVLSIAGLFILKTLLPRRLCCHLFWHVVFDPPNR